MNQSQTKSTASKHKDPTKHHDHADESVPVSLAGFWRRAIAWLYDLLGGLAVFILALVTGQLVIWLATFWWVDDFDALTHQLSMNPMWALYLLGVVQYYYCWCWVKGGQTMGMKTWRMQLITQDKKYLSWKQAWLRSLLSLGGIANIWSLVDGEKRGWHDIAVGSLVVVYPKGHRWVSRNDEQDKPLI